jgi:hypothetical protein
MTQNTNGDERGSDAGGREPEGHERARALPPAPRPIVDCAEQDCPVQQKLLRAAALPYRA